MSSQIVDIALVAAGLVLAVLAIILHKRLSGQQVIDMAAEKLGVALKTNAFGLVILLGCLMVIAGIFLKYQQYESKIKSLEGQKTVWDQFSQEFKTHSMRLHLIFPDGDKPDPADSRPIDKKAYVQKLGMAEVKLNSADVFRTELGGIVATVEKLNYGDRLRVEIEGGNKKWRSAEIVMPAAHLQMYAIK